MTTTGHSHISSTLSMFTIISSVERTSQIVCSFILFRVKIFNLFVSTQELKTNSNNNRFSADFTSWFILIDVTSRSKHLNQALLKRNVKKTSPEKIASCWWNFVSVSVYNKLCGLRRPDSTVCFDCDAHNKLNRSTNESKVVIHCHISPWKNKLSERISGSIYRFYSIIRCK